MASGTPDYYQTVRMTYGAARREIGIVVANANIVTEILRVEGKGIIYGGVCNMVYTLSQRDSYFRLTIDGELMTVWTFEDMMRFGIVKDNSNTLYMLSYNDVNFEYSVGISSKLTFDESVLVEYKEAHGGSPDVAGHLIYAVIE